MKYTIAEQHTDKTAFILEIKNYFENSEHSIHKARNEIKIIEYSGVNYVVKSFKKPHMINQIAYTFFRDSKAKRSFTNALKIKMFTPDPIGYIEFFKHGLLESSYYISAYFDYDFTIREPLQDQNFPDRESIFKALAHFTYTLHDQNIVHKDYSPGNILIQKKPDGYQYTLVDINRMYFKKFSISDRMKNFAKLGASKEDLRIIIEEYVKTLKENFSILYQEAVYYSDKHQTRLTYKRFFKKLKKKVLK
ncbi:MAG: hypothetical protein K0U47_01145 [Epsilonproteobacteria bacterium]|nr:hypothetical protein [Campylobacterota bacterium]